MQRALHVEVERMKKALETEDARSFQSMTTWWSASNSFPATFSLCGSQNSFCLAPKELFIAGKCGGKEGVQV